MGIVEGVKKVEGDGSTRIGAVLFLVPAGREVGVQSCRDPREVWLVLLIVGTASVSIYWSTCGRDERREGSY